MKRFLTISTFAQILKIKKKLKSLPCYFTHVPLRSLQILPTPIKSNKWLNLIVGMNLVIITMWLSTIGMFFTTISLYVITSLIKFILTSICLVLSWNILFLVKCMTFWQLQYILIKSYCKPKLSTKPLS